MSVGYYGDLDIQLTEQGHERGSESYYRAGAEMERQDCLKAHERERCIGCPDRTDPGCIWNLRGLGEVKKL